MSAITLVFPHQLSETHPALAPGRPVWMLEEWLFFRQYRFHGLKLMLHRASMRCYREQLIARGYTVHYVEAHDELADIRAFLPWIRQQGVEEIGCAHPEDDWLVRRLIRGCTVQDIRLQLMDHPLFLNTLEETTGWFGGRKRFFHHDFYLHQRKTRRILLDEAGNPQGGQWSFDKDNRKKYPAGQTPPRVDYPPENPYIEEARAYVLRHFPDHYGDVTGTFPFPVTHSDSRDWLHTFIGQRLTAFGPYEDAMVSTAHFLHHSVLTPMLNIGLLTPQQIVDAVLQPEVVEATPLPSLEGFVRQVIGWREYIRGIYHIAGRQERTRHYWSFNRKLPEAFWTGETGIPPVDGVIRKIRKTGYAHHIERLMVLGNFMLLCEFDPDDVYRWFMEMFVDAYDWVMVPNVYGMSQFADGGLMATKPYISGSNYLMKMSDFEKGPWQAVWDGLFWRFLHTHRSFFLQNPRLAMLVRTFDKMPEARQRQHLQTAEAWLTRWD